MKQASRIGPRRHARECAVQILYQLDAQLSGGKAHEQVERELDLYFSHLFPGEEFETTALSPEVESFARRLVEGVAARSQEVDDTIQQASQNWRLERMSRVDRNVLRLAVFEMLHLSESPRRVVLNEAIELAKKFGTQESGAFINGILDRIGHEHGMDESPTAGRKGRRRRD